VKICSNCGEVGDSDRCPSCDALMMDENDLERIARKMERRKRYASSERYDNLRVKLRRRKRGGKR